MLRLLDKQAGRLDLTSLGMDDQSLFKMDELIHKPHGIILVTGPTGSGKTTTLYAALERINDNSRNIMTVEDPIEYFIDGIGQTQVNTKVEMRPGNRRDCGSSQLDRTPGVINPAYQHSGRRCHKTTRYGCGTIPAVLEFDWRAGPASRAGAR